MALLFSVLLNAAPVKGLLSAELSYKRVSEMEYEINLVHVLKCSGSNVGTPQAVSIFEGIAGMPNIDLVLELTGSEEQNIPSPGPCGNDYNSCFVTVEYSGKIALPMIQGGYNVVWQMADWDIENWNNIKMNQKGLSLVVRIDEISEINKSTPGFLTDLPVALCVGKQSIPIPLQMSGEPSEEFKVRFSAPLTAISTMDLIASTEIIMPPMGGETASGPFFPNAAPPYNEVKYRKGFSALMPLGAGKATISKEMNTIELLSDKPGDYLIGLSVESEVDGKKTSESQRIIVVQFYQ